MTTPGKLAEHTTLPSVRPRRPVEEWTVTPLRTTVSVQSALATAEVYDSGQIR